MPGLSEATSRPSSGFLGHGVGITTFMRSRADRLLNQLRMAVVGVPVKHPTV